jgi:hypothetical protein
VNLHKHEHTLKAVCVEVTGLFAVVVKSTTLVAVAVANTFPLPLKMPYVARELKWKGKKRREGGKKG